MSVRYERGYTHSSRIPGGCRSVWRRWIYATVVCSSRPAASRRSGALRVVVVVEVARWLFNFSSRGHNQIHVSAAPLWFISMLLGSVLSSEPN